MVSRFTNKLGDETSPYPITPDERYFVVRGRLWRCSNPALSVEERLRWTAALMKARRAKGVAMRSGGEKGREIARQQVEQAENADSPGGPMERRTETGTW